ncbi:MAG: hypothetical protein KJ955_05000 [Nanoarchaeota archaeon]|nr:hypothetical protein [Nanoarchaeota archaeon]
MKKEANNYTKILESVVKQIEQSKLRAFSEVNKALLQAYWNIGEELSKTSEYGKAVVERLSRDLRQRFPGIKGYSVANLWYMKKFYESYPILQTLSVELPLPQKLQPVVGELPSSRKLQSAIVELPSGRKLQMPSRELSLKLQTASTELPLPQKLQPVAVELLTCQKLQTVSEELLFSLSWSNHILIMELT